MTNTSLAVTVAGIEATVEGHGKDIDDIRRTNIQMLLELKGLRSDITTATATMTESHNIHVLADERRFGKLDARLAYYLGIGTVMGGAASCLITLLTQAILAAHKLGGG